MLAATLIGAFLPVDEGNAARLADRHGGLNAVCDTALHLQKTAHPVAGAVALDALDALGNVEPPPLMKPRGVPAVFAAMLLGLFVVGVLKVTAPEPEPVAGPGDEMLAQLDAIESDARRKGQVELVEAVQELRARVQAVQAASEAQPTEPVARHEPAPPPIAAPPPEPPEPEAEDELPREFNSQAAYDEALDDARESMLSDDQLLAEFSSQIESRLMDVTQLEQMGNDLLGATLKNVEMAGQGGFSDFEGSSPAAQQQTMNRANSALPDEFQQNTADVVGMSGKTDLEDSFSESHELAQGLQKTYQDFLEAYADALRDELVDALEEAQENVLNASDRPGSRQLDNTGQGQFESDQHSNSDIQAKSDGTQNANFQPRDDVQGEIQNTQLAQLGGQGKQMAGGGGTGGPSGAPNEGVDPLGEAGGDLEQLQGGFGPGNLSGEQRQQVLEAIEGKSVQTGPGSDFNDAWTGYFDEVDRALVEEDMPPLMQNMVAAYFAGLKEER